MLSWSACAAEHAELIFCPYNYLLDPVIRRAVQVDVEDAVLILDEAHNIEDICRCACPAKGAQRVLLVLLGAMCASAPLLRGQSGAAIGPAGRHALLAAAVMGGLPCMFQTWAPRHAMGLRWLGEMLSGSGMVHDVCCS